MGIPGCLSPREPHGVGGPRVLLVLGTPRSGGSYQGNPMRWGSRGGASLGDPETGWESRMVLPREPHGVGAIPALAWEVEWTVPVALTIESLLVASRVAQGGACRFLWQVPTQTQVSLHTLDRRAPVCGCHSATPVRHVGPLERPCESLKNTCENSGAYSLFRHC